MALLASCCLWVRGWVVGGPWASPTHPFPSPSFVGQCKMQRIPIPTLPTLTAQVYRPDQPRPARPVPTKAEQSWARQCPMLNCPPKTPPAQERTQPTAKSKQPALHQPPVPDAIGIGSNGTSGFASQGKVRNKNSGWRFGGWAIQSTYIVYTMDSAFVLQLQETTQMGFGARLNEGRRRPGVCIFLSRVPVYLFLRLSMAWPVSSIQMGLANGVSMHACL